jgi:hypothetical protein
MKKTLLIVLLGAFFISCNSFAQSSFWGLNVGTTNLEGSDAYTNDISAGGAGFSTEFHAGMLVKMQFPISPITPVISFNYTSMKGNIGGTETSQSIYSLGLGAQFTITAGRVSPYIALDIAYNYFGKYEVTNPSAGYSPSTDANGPTALSSKSRMGGGAGVGVDLNLIQGIDIDLSGRVMILNLLGKKNSEDNLQSFTINAAILF